MAAKDCGLLAHRDSAHGDFARRGSPATSPRQLPASDIQLPHPTDVSLKVRHELRREMTHRCSGRRRRAATYYRLCTGNKRFSWIFCRHSGHSGCCEEGGQHRVQKHTERNVRGARAEELTLSLAHPTTHSQQTVKR